MSFTYLKKESGKKLSYLKSVIIAFSLYSRIPMPVFDWDEDNMKHVLSFLPLVGIVIGLLGFLYLKLCSLTEIPAFAGATGLLLIPVLVTGGFHADGFMDVQDALKSYGDREKKLDIMKDPHVGAFAVISILTASLIWLASLYLMAEKSMSEGRQELVYVYLALFCFVRGFCGISCIIYKKARDSGMLKTETGRLANADTMILIFWILLSWAVMLIFSIAAAVAAMALMILFTMWYGRMCDRNFGGVTGDTAGYFVVTGELVITALLAVMSLFLM